MNKETSKAARAAVGHRKHKRSFGKRLANKGSRKLAKNQIAKGDY